MSNNTRVCIEAIGRGQDMPLMRAALSCPSHPFPLPFLSSFPLTPPSHPFPLPSPLVPPQAIFLRETEMSEVPSQSPQVLATHDGGTSGYRESHTT